MRPTLFQARVPLVPRDYQHNDHDESFRLWDEGVRGVLTRIFTGGGKTPTTCQKIKTWLRRGDNYHAMIVSYERDLVWQFAQEVEDFLGITPGIEMGDEHVPADQVPPVVVASRASLLPARLATPRQIDDLAQYGFPNAGDLPRRLCKRFLRHLAAGGDPDLVTDDIGRFRAEALAPGQPASRLHKFDWRLNWLVVFDEAHRHAHSLKSVGHIVDWFDRNPLSRRSGLTATPKRGDGISIGHKMFPGVAIDYPLCHLTRPCAVRDGWAVPYVQKYIEVEGVDFKNLKRVKGDFDEAELERVLGEEGQLAKLVQPLLDMVDDRRTLVFSPGKEMAKNVARYVNARRKAVCPDCQARRWYPSRLIGDGAACPCGRAVQPGDVTRDRDPARSINGDTPEHERKQVYRAHQGGHFQFLSVCGLCREGYNDPDIACVAVFRPVSKKASSLAEQMKGRGCRPCRSVVPVLNELLTPEERVEAIATSEKPDCLIVDLVGITGLADCASTVQIYAEGLDDEVTQRAAELLEDGGRDEGGADVEKVVRRAKAEVEAERAEAERRRREEAETRAKAQAEVTYTEHAMGVGGGPDAKPGQATAATYNLLSFLGMEVLVPISQRRAGRMIDFLKQRMPRAEVARLNGLSDGDWKPVGPSEKQARCLRRQGIAVDESWSGWDASQLIGAHRQPDEFERKKLAEIQRAADGGALDGVAWDVRLAKRVLPPDSYRRLVEAGKARRHQLLQPTC
jgi:superfamily II DNA or RNA helicase